ncbi:MAG TPA: extracellular solute-binding protein [Actinocrinis sp.]|jgi:ABC-type glycerol-3-phosphate transport system substrate-binding protein
MPLSRRGFLAASAAAVGGTALTTGLTGCSSSSSSSSSGATTTITHWDWWTSQAPWLQNEIKLFQQKNPKITIKRTVQSSDQYPNLINLAFRGGEAPDVLMIANTPPFDNQVSMGWLKNLNSYATSQWQSRFPAGNFFNGVDMVSDRIYSAPFSGNAPWLQLYIHNGLFKQAGITNRDGSVKLPKTWDDVSSAAAAIVNKTGGKAYGIGFGNSDSSVLPWWIELFVRGAGSPMGYGTNGPDYRVGKWVFGSDRNYADLINLILEWKQKGYIYPEVMSIGDEQARAFFQQGKFGMTVGGVWNQPSWSQAGFTDYSLTTLPSPTERPKAYFYYQPGGELWAISKDAKNADEAWQWFDWLYSEPAGERWVEAQQGLSIFPQANNAAKVKFAPFESYVGYTDWALTWPVPSIRNPAAAEVTIPSVTPDLPDVLTGLFTGQITDMASALSALEDRRNQALATGVQQAQAKGVKVSVSDWVFKDWDPTKPYQNKPA